MEVLKEEKMVQDKVAQLVKLLAEHDQIKEFKQIEGSARQSQELLQLEEKMKAAQKEAVQLDHYDKPEAARQKNLEIDRLKKDYEEHPLVLSYRQKLKNANEIVQYITENFEQQINEAIEEEELHASKD